MKDYFLKPSPTPARLAGDDTADRAASSLIPGAASPSAPPLFSGASAPRTEPGPTGGDSGRARGRAADLSRSRAKEWRAAQERANLCEAYLRLTREEHYPLVSAARALGASPSQFSGPASMLARYQRGGVAALVETSGPPQTVRSGALTEQIEALGWFIPAAKFFYLLSNRADGLGSVPEAVRRTISLPHLPVGWQTATRQRFLRAISCDPAPTCPQDLREAILARQSAGQPLVPSRIARQITVARPIVRGRRHPGNAALDYFNASGSLFFITDRLTGERRPPLTGEVIEADDATINFPVCVPWSLGGDPCSDKFGVKIGRFQWLVAVDAARRFVTAWTYVMRPRSSYRAEDALALMRAHCLQHGIPGQWRFEQGVWKSNLVKHAVAGMGSQLHTVWSPHQKPYIEGLFNTLWTKLSVQFPDSDVGRFRGETEDAADLLVACQRGSRDPRRHFPMLATALDAFRETVDEKNRTPVHSTIGRWIPEEAWQSRSGAAEGTAAYPKRPLAAETEWLFSPYVREWTVKGMLVGGRVPLFEDLSVPFDFSADWLTSFHGARVRCHFNPAAPRCQAMVVLAQNFNGRKCGEVLGLARQINEVAGYARLVLGWGDDPASAGRLARQQAAGALRREIAAVTPNGKGYSASEERDGVNQVVSVERDAAANRPPAAAQTAERATFDPERLERAARFEELTALDYS